MKLTVALLNQVLSENTNVGADVMRARLVERFGLEVDDALHTLSDRVMHDVVNEGRDPLGTVGGALAILLLAVAKGTDARVVELLAEVDAWKTASGLEDGRGDPDGITPQHLESYLARLTTAAEAALGALEDPDTAWTVAGTLERQALRRTLGRDVRPECDGCGVDLPAFRHSPGCKTGGGQ